jgi:hypothetical protein
MESFSAETAKMNSAIATSFHPLSCEGCVLSPAGARLFRARFIEVSKAGLYVCSDDPPPPLLSRIAVVLDLPEDQLLECACQVVRHVSPAQAFEWGIPQGFGIQFIEPSPAWREAMSRALQELRTGHGSGAGKLRSDDAQAELVLRHYRRGLHPDPYEVLGLPEDADFHDVRRAARESRATLEALRRRPLSSARRQQLLAATDQVIQAAVSLGNLARRAEIDAERGNFAGVAHCIGAGLTAGDLEAARRRHLTSHPAAAACAQVRLLAARELEARSDFTAALREIECALALDPLNLELHRRRQMLRRVAAHPPVSAHVEAVTAC